jgi:hypothetical protein
MRLSHTRFLCKNSLELVNSSNKFYVEETGYLMTVNNQTLRGFSQALKLHFSKKLKLDILDFVKNKDSILVCAFCGRRNSRFDVTYQLNNKSISVQNVVYRNQIYNCFKSGCQGANLNPNSVEFVSKTRKISEAEAVNLIHSRNKSKFYKENHESIDDYRRYQGSRVFGKSEPKIREILLKQQKSRIKTFQEFKCERKRKTLYSFISETHDGKLLHSNLERKFYSMLVDCGLDSSVHTSGFYENSILMYDFFFPKINMYVEIAGFSSSDYLDRISEKQKKFNCVVLTGKDLRNSAKMLQFMNMLMEQHHAIRH